MKINANTTITGSKVTLVPYRAEHVLKYHNWMTSEWIRKMTASEPLTLDEEYEMQRTWFEDADKLTFIVLDRSRPDEPNTTTPGGGMAGDVNLFLIQDDDLGPDIAEMEIMIAEEASRGKGLGTEAVRLMMEYGKKHLGIKKFVAKITKENEASLQMFRKIGYKDYKYVECFEEMWLIFDAEQLPASPASVTESKQEASIDAASRSPHADPSLSSASASTSTASQSQLSSASAAHSSSASSDPSSSANAPSS